MTKKCPECGKFTKDKCSCGCYFEDGIWFDTQDIALCPECNNYMAAIYDNVGYTAPDPEKVITVGFKCIECGITIDA